MNNIKLWLVKNWKYLALILIIIWLWKGQGGSGVGIIRQRMDTASVMNVGSASKLGFGGGVVPMPFQEAAPVDAETRMVVRDTSLSLVVKDVTGTISEIESRADSLGGWMVNSNLSRPEEGGSGTITIRVPEEKRAEALEVFRSMAVKVVSESVSGYDVTDEYVDIESRLAVLMTTKRKFEEILASAVRVQDLLEVQRELVNLQQQIDSLKGQQKYLEQTAKLSRITIYLSTDELALPYAPSDAWRPAVIFKQAVRSLVGNLRQIGSGLIWLLVYLPIALPILAIIWWIKRRKQL